MLLVGSESWRLTWGGGAHFAGSQNFPEKEPRPYPVRLYCPYPSQVDAELALKCRQRQEAQLKRPEILGISYFFVFLGTFKFSTIKSFIPQISTMCQALL